MNHLDGLSDKAAQAPETTDTIESQEQKGSEQPQSKGTEEAIFDLSQAKKFKFEDQEWTPNDLKNAILRQQDYTRKTQALAEERKFVDNLDADLRYVKENPRLIEQFKKTYPEKFHRFLDVLGLNQDESKTEVQGPQVPKELLDRLGKIEETFNAKERESFDKALDVIEKDLTSKYPYASLTDVYGFADRFMKENNVNPAQVDAKLMEPFFKASHEHALSQYKAWQKEELNKQREASKSAADVGRGGGTPGEAPRKYKRLGDVADDMVEAIKRG